MSWKTTIFGLMAAIGGAIVSAYAMKPELLAPFPSWLPGLGFLLSVVGTACLGVFARDNNKTSEDVGAGGKESGGAQLVFLFLIAVVSALIVCSGCARFKSVQIKTEADGSRTESRQTVTTLFDAKSEIGKLRASTTDKTQGLTVGSINEETSGSNTVALTEAIVRAAVTGAVKSVAP